MNKRKDNEYFLYVKTEQSFFLKMKFSLTVCLKCINCMTVQRGHTILRLFLLTLPDKTCFYEKWEMRVYSCITYKLSQRIFLNWKTWCTSRKKCMFFPDNHLCLKRSIQIYKKGLIIVKLYKPHKFVEIHYLNGCDDERTGMVNINS